MSKEVVIYLLMGFCVLIVVLNDLRKTHTAKPLSLASHKGWLLGAQVVLLIGFLLRIVYLQYPYYLHMDEAMNGYESWCLANYGVDQHLHSYPVYFKSWGSGQSALYAYLSIPFVKLFGLSTSVYRIPMALVSCSALAILYGTLKRSKKDNFFIFLAVLFFVINPWHLMKSRWALDCNLSPDFILIGVCLFVWGYYAIQRKLAYYVAGCFFFALAAYSYGVNWIMLPLLLLLLFIYFYKKKQISLVQIFGCVCASIVFLFPLMLFAILVLFGGETYDIAGITIPKLDSPRQNSTTLFGSNQPLVAFAGYMKKGASMLLLGSDGYEQNGIPFYGQFYNILGLPFVLLAFVKIIKTKTIDSLDTVFLIWIVAMLPIVLFVEPNINHWNALWLPLSYMCVIGMHSFFSRNKLRTQIGVISLLVLGVMFCTAYFRVSQELRWWYADQDRTLNFTKTLPVDSVFMGNFYYATTLFYSPVNPYEFNATVRKNDGLFMNVKSYGNRYFSLPHEIKPKPKVAYILSNSFIKDYNVDEKKFKQLKGKSFTVLWNE